MNSRWLQSTNFTSVRSSITGRVILRNDDPAKFLVSEAFALETVGSVCDRVITSWNGTDGWHRIEGTKYASAILALVAPSSPEAFVDGFDDLIDIVRGGEETDGSLLVRSGLRTKVFELVAALWASQVMAIPTRMPFSARTQIDLGFPELRANAPWVIEVERASNSKVDVHRRRAALRAVRLAMTGLGVQEVGDVVPGAVQPSAIVGARERGGLVMAVRPILAIQKAVYGLNATVNEHDWGVGRGKYCPPVRFEDTESRSPDLNQWLVLLKEWFEHPATGTQNNKAETVKVIVNYLASNPMVARDPLAFVSRKYQPQPRFEEWIDQQGIEKETAVKRISKVAAFFDWYVDVKLAQEDDFGRPIRNPLFCNPVTRRKGGARASETAREALPIKFIRELIFIISHNDFEWAKSVNEDYVTRLNPVTQEWERVWCPVRAYAMLIKLYLPLRTYQVCMLDSGEADSEVFVDGGWRKNDSALVSRAAKSVRQGFLRQFIDSTTKRDFTGFYVNTNKTADRFKDNEDRGYEIPWQQDEVIGIVGRMLEWQKTYNPILQPTPWAAITHPTVTRAFTPAQLKARGKSAFLFRDPAKANKDHPIYVGRLASYWKKLLDELERRVADRGEVLPNGLPLRFIEKRSPTGVPQNPAFDLHTLRVSILTALAVDGGVPLEILSKCVAGHATTLMTLYYIKMGPTYISQQLAEAQTKMLVSEQDNYLRFLQDCDLKSAESVVAYNDQVGLLATQSNSPSGWVVSDIGLCPVGGARCHEGGPRHSSESSRNVFMPTPGGARNCARCRFFLTGPAFLGGLVAHFNAIGLEVIDASERLRAMQKDIAKLEDDVFEKNLGAQTEAYRTLNTLYSRLEDAMATLDAHANNWHAVFALIERSKSILESTSPRAREGQRHSLQLVTNTDIDGLGIAMGEASKLDLYDSICQHATVFPAPVVPTASLRRGRILDAMLTRNTRQPIFASLSDDEALGVGNQMMALLQARLGHHETHKLMEGKRLLAATGVAEELDVLIARGTSEAVKLGNLPGARRLPMPMVTNAEDGIK